MVGVAWVADTSCCCLCVGVASLYSEGGLNNEEDDVYNDDDFEDEEEEEDAEDSKEELRKSLSRCVLHLIPCLPF